MRYKRFLATILSLAMLIGLFPVMNATALAGEGDFAMDLLVYKYTLDDRGDPVVDSTPIDLSTMPLQKDDTIIIALRYKNITQFGAALNMISWGYTYDAEYINPVYSTTITANDSLATTSYGRGIARDLIEDNVNVDDYAFDFSDRPMDTYRAVKGIQGISANTTEQTLIKGEEEYLIYLPYTVCATSGTTQIGFLLTAEDSQVKTYDALTESTFTQNTTTLHKIGDGTLNAADYIPLTVNIGQVLPVASTFAGETKTAIDELASIAASADTDTRAKLTAKLPTGDVTVADADGNTYTASITSWTQTDTTEPYDPKSGTYTYKPVFANNENVNLATLADTEVSIKITSVTLALSKAIQNVAVPEGTETVTTHAGLGLTTEGTATAGSTSFNYSVSYTPDANLDTSDTSATQTFTPTVKYYAAEDTNKETELDLATAYAWITIPENLVPASVTATVSAKPVATDLTADTKTAITTAAAAIKASSANNTEDYLVIKTANLPTSGKVTDGTNEYDVTLTWSTTDAYNAKGATYNYTAEVSSKDANVSGLEAPTASITVNPVTLTLPTSFDAKSVAKGADNSSHEALGLTTSGKAADSDGIERAYTVAWDEASTTLDTSVENESATFNGTISVTDAPAWLTLPDSLAVTQTLTVAPLPVATDLTADTKAAITTAAAAIKASSANNTEEYLIINKANLPTSGKVTDGTKEYEVKLTWTTTDAYNAKGAAYNYTATVDAKNGDVNVSSLAAPTASLTVETVTAAYADNAFADISVAKDTDNSSYAALGLAESGTATDGEGNEYAYTIAWNEDSTTLDTSTEGASAAFTGTVTFTNAPEWLTLPDTAVSQTLTVAALPIATDLTDDTKAAIEAAAAVIKASDANNTEEYLITNTANLPTSGKVTDGENEYDVTLTWNTADIYNAKGGAYTYTATVEAANGDVTVTNVSVPQAAVTVEAVTAAYADNAFADVSVAKGTDNAAHESLGLTTSGTATDSEGNEYEYTVAWNEDSTTLDTSAEGASVTFTGTVTFTNAPEWLTLPDTAVSQKASVPARGTQNKPDAVEAAVDAATNNIVITAPLGETIEYSKDGGATWQDEPTFTGLALGTEYSITARVKETEELNASDATDVVKLTTYKYRVRAFKKNADITTAAPAREIYTNTETVSSDSDINTGVFASKPSNFKAYYTDKACATADKAVYPYTITEDTVFYYTTGNTSSGGGGGGTSSYTVKFEAGENGAITSGTASVSVSSGSAVASSKIPTVTAKEGYVFEGWSQDGKTVVDPTTVTVTKAVTFTALYKESETEPEPTKEPSTEPEPTAEPIIRNDYTKPYASGYIEGDFRPDAPITRAELASMIARLSYGDDLPNGVYSASFADVDADAWYSKYIGYLENLDVLTGYEDGNFLPEDLVSRSEMCAVIARAQKYDLIGYNGEFEDVTGEDWANGYIATLTSKGIISGYGDGTFGPYSPLTRAETVTIINKLLAPSEPVVSFTPSDIGGHWAESEIILAVNEREAL